MIFTTAYAAGEGYQPSPILLNHIFAITQFVKAEDLPNTMGGTLNSTCKFGSPL